MGRGPSRSWRRSPARSSWRRWWPAWSRRTGDLPSGSADQAPGLLGGRGLLPRIGRAPPSAASHSSVTGRPRTALMITTAMAAPSTGPAIYTHHPVKSVLTMSGPSVRAGFIDAPLMGLANNPSRAMVAPTASAALWPMLRYPVAVLRITETRIAVSTISITNDFQSPPGLLIG